MKLEPISNKLDNLHIKYQHILEAEKSANETLIEQYIVFLGDLERRYLSSPPTHPREITIPEIFRRSYNENFISDYLAYILDPTVNGIGSEPLSILINNLFPENKISNFDDVEIEREYDVGGGRIDFLIWIGESTIIGIENKLYSPEGDKQTRFYARKIINEYPEYDCFFIFLTPSGLKASSSKFLSVPYSQVWELLRSIHYDWKSDIRKSIYWEDFLTHLEVYIMDKNNFEFSPRSKLYLENFKMIDDLQKAFNLDWQKLIELIETNLQLHIQDGNWNLNFHPTRLNYHQVFNRNWEYPNLNIHYEYQFSPAKMSKFEFDFMFEVEAKRAKDFISIFDSMYPSMADKYNQLGILFLPRNRKHAVAYKVYKFETFPEWDIEFIKAFDEFSFLNSYIDQALKKLIELDSK